MQLPGNPDSFLFLGFYEPSTQGTERFFCAPALTGIDGDADNLDRSAVAVSTPSGFHPPDHAIRPQNAVFHKIVGALIERLPPLTVDPFTVFWVYSIQETVESNF